MSEYYAVVRSTDHLAHYGVKGMKWGVRKAVVMGNERQLDKHFRKAAKKLKKLQDKALHSKKYAAKAAAYGAAAAGTGAIAIGGAQGINTAAGRVADLMKKRSAMLKYQNSVQHPVAGKTGHTNAISNHARNEAKIKAYESAAESVSKAGNAVGEWGKRYTTLSSSPKMFKDSKGEWHAHPRLRNEVMVNNNTLMRIGAGAATLGLGAAAAKNAYTAANGRKYLDKAENWRREMDNAFAGTKYEGQYVRTKKKRRR